jgi:cobalt-precorrin 5A hydrolase/precorrin-3B C17-methyltransferase
MNTGNRITVFFLTKRAAILAERLKGLYPEAKAVRFAKETVTGAWERAESLVFIMASGIVVRTIAPLLRDKRTDPSVVVIDESGRYAVSLLSGHLGGANEKAREIAAFLNGEAVITTASDIQHLTSIDLFARRRDLVIDDWKLLSSVAGRLVNRGTLAVFSDTEIDLPPEYMPVPDPASADLVVTNRTDITPTGALSLRPRNLVIGVGCNRGTSHEEIEGAVRGVLELNRLAFSSVTALATIDIKAGEPGLLVFACAHGLPVLSYSVHELNGVADVAPSEAALKATGARAVAEPAAMLGAQAGALLVRKQKKGNVTVAIATVKDGQVWAAGNRRQTKEKSAGRIYVVGTGPGDRDHITPSAVKAIEWSEAIVGYAPYIEQVRTMIKGKEVYETGMTEEIERCRKAVRLALDGRTVALISGGDPGIYAMAGLLYEVLGEQEEFSQLPSVEVIPGVSALNACAARLGAPLMHDFASISLSDRLTPWEIIEKRIDAAAMADFVIVLYNPKSKGRRNHIDKARDLVLRHRSPETPVGIVTGAMRENEKIVVTDLDRMLGYSINMHTTVIIGNSRTCVWKDRMITPRGYEGKF